MQKEVKLTEIEGLRLENLAMKRDLAQQRLAAFTADLNREIGFIVSREGGTFQSVDLNKGVMMMEIAEQAKEKGDGV